MTKLSYFKFLLLSLSEKKQYLQQNGTLLLSYPNKEGELCLYALSNFFVELQSDDQQEIVHILSFKDTNRLEEHVQQIKLTQLNVY
jgi:hypothetical protein